MSENLPKGTEDTIRLAALYNAFRHGGKADTGAVLGRVLAENPELRGFARKLSSMVSVAVSEVNKLTPEQQKESIKRLKPELLQEKGSERKKEGGEEFRRLPPLPNIEKYKRVVTRFAPNPDSVLHLGSTRAIILSHDYARMYSGMFILRYEDTDPRLKKSAISLYRYVLEDLEWLGCTPDQIFYQSDRLEIYYDYAVKLIELGGAYVCTCSQEKFRSSVTQGRACPDRNVGIEENISRWQKMIDGSYAEGEAVLRVKTDLKHPNPAVRDWPAMRIIDTKRYRHPRVGSKYRVWPLYNWSAGLDDHLLGVTHIIRGQEHATNAVRQKYFYKAFGWSYPDAIHYGRLKIEGGELSKSKIEKGIREKLYSGYDDPRLATLRALRRRGISPQAIRRLILEVGPKPNDATVSWENLLAYNRQLIDRTSPRHFAVFDPIQLNIHGVPDETLRISLHRHPDIPEMGSREFTLHKKNAILRLVVPRTELKAGQTYRLIGLMNIQVSPSAAKGARKAQFAGYSLDEARKIGAKALQWLPDTGNINIDVVMPDATIKKGLAESQLEDEKVGTVVQFERQFFARLDSKDGVYVFYFTSK